MMEHCGGESRRVIKMISGDGPSLKGGGTRCRAQNRDSVRSGRKRGFVMTTSHKRASVNGRVSGLIEMNTQSRSPKRDTRRGTETRPEGTSKLGY